MASMIDSMKDHLKEIVFYVPKDLLRPVVAVLWHLGLSQRSFYIYSKLGFPDVVLQGPFKGMKYLPSSVCSAILPKYLGTYEKELWSAIEKLRDKHPDIVLDVGSAEGFYGVGLTILLQPNSTHCFDIDRRAIRLLCKNAELNDVSKKIKAHHGCSVKDLEDLLCQAKNPVVKMDVEGCEDELLDPIPIPSLRKAEIIVEVHEGLRPGMFRRLEERFSTTHLIQRLQPLERSVHDLPPHVTMSLDDLGFAMDEAHSTEVGWYIMHPRGQN